MEVPWLLGPPDGRYLLRRTGDGAEGHAGERSWDVTATERGEPTHVLLFATLGRVMRSFRAVTSSAHARAPARAQLLVARIGFGEGEQVAYGQWTDALELQAAAARQKRSKLLEPQARLAAALGGRTPVPLCDDLVLRARDDLDAGRPRAAALQLKVALDAALSELAPQMAAGVQTRITELAAQLDGVTDAAAAALRGELTDAELQTVSFTLGRIEAALRARALASQA